MFTKDREFFYDQADVAVSLKHLCHFGMRFAAIPTTIIQKFNQRDVTIRIAAYK